MAFFKNLYNCSYNGRFVFFSKGSMRKSIVLSNLTTFIKPRARQVLGRGVPPGIAAARNAVIAAAADCHLLLIHRRRRGGISGMAASDGRAAAAVWRPSGCRDRPCRFSQGRAELGGRRTTYDVPAGRPVPPSSSPAAATSSIDLSGTAQLAPHFDIRFGILGGSDTHFFMRARRAGLAMLWCDEAVVTEEVPLKIPGLAGFSSEGSGSATPSGSANERSSRVASASYGGSSLEPRRASRAGQGALSFLPARSAGTLLPPSPGCNA